MAAGTAAPWTTCPSSTGTTRSWTLARKTTVPSLPKVLRECTVQVRHVGRNWGVCQTLLQDPYGGTLARVLPVRACPPTRPSRSPPFSGPLLPRIQCRPHVRVPPVRGPAPNCDRVLGPSGAFHPDLANGVAFGLVGPMVGVHVGPGPSGPPAAPAAETARINSDDRRMGNGRTGHYPNCTVFIRPRCIHPCRPLDERAQGKAGWMTVRGQCPPSDNRWRTSRARSKSTAPRGGRRHSTSC